MKHSLGEWCGAIAASACVGIAVAIVVDGAVAVGSRLEPGLPGLLVGSGYAAGGLLGVGTAVHFVRLFRIGEVESRDIWRSVGKAFIASADD